MVGVGQVEQRAVTAPDRADIRQRLVEMALVGAAASIAAAEGRASDRARTSPEASSVAVSVPQRMVKS